MTKYEIYREVVEIPYKQRKLSSMESREDKCKMEQTGMALEFATQLGANARKANAARRLLSRKKYADNYSIEVEILESGVVKNKITFIDGTYLNLFYGDEK